MDLRELQRVLDESHRRGGSHLREVISDERRLDAAALAARLTGMRLLVLGTVTADGRPLVSPVDGIFHRGRFHFGSSPASVRMRHIARRPWVSATHLDGEEFAVTVHGRAEVLDLRTPEHAAFRETLLEIYVPRFGAEWERLLDGSAVYARIEPERMFTFHLPAGGG